jgi:nucleoside-diphosphate-sugar epimerase
MHALVTGGGGFLGGYIVEALLARGDRVRSFGRGEYPQLRARGVEVLRGDIRDNDALSHACAGVDCVFHAAALPGIGMDREAYRTVNQVGTELLLANCRRHGVRRFVYTSSPSVVFAGRDQCGVNESAPYDFGWMRANRAYYSESKACAEQAVLAANSERLRTCALRPHLIWGPGDTHLVPRLIRRARAGRLRRVGNGTNLVDITYVENAAEAHLLAADALAADSEQAGGASPPAGKVYFISQGEPVNCWQWIDDVLALAQLPPVKKSMSLKTASRIGAACEIAYRLSPRTSEPPMTRFLAAQLATSHWFDISAARRDLGYTPRVSTREGMRRLGEWFRASFTSKLERRRTITNSSDELMLLMIEPCAWDYWLMPGETLELRAPVHSLNADFQITHDHRKIEVWPSEGMIDISVYKDNLLLALGYQRPHNWPHSGS